ncbi:MAG TPA: phytanoyl-CoA dioxygenase family protein [Armatimonadota bacterium]|jgi:hypothetical protein
MHIAVTRPEVEEGRLTPPHLEAALQALREEGYVVLEDVIDLEHVATLRDRMLEDALSILSLPNRPFNWNPGNIQQEPPPFPPFLFRDVLLNPVVLQVTTALLGPGVKNTFYSGNTSLPGPHTQPVHADIGHLWPNLKEAHPAYAVVVNVPVVDMSPHNGSTEIWPGTHLDPRVSVDSDIKVQPEWCEARRAQVPPLQPSVRAGSVLLRDMRLWHRGMPNHSQGARPMIAMIHACGWWDAARLVFPKEAQPFFQDSPLRMDIDFVDGPVDYIGRLHGYEYEEA